MEPSIFTRIINGDIPSYKIYEDDRVLAFLDIYPTQPGHVLVVPKEQIDRVEELPDELYYHVMSVVKMLANHLRKQLNVARTTLKVEGFDVPHAHIHLIPCNTAKEFWQQPDRAAEPDHAALKAMADKLSLL